MRVGILTERDKEFLETIKIKIDQVNDGTVLFAENMQNITIAPVNDISQDITITFVDHSLKMLHMKLAVVL